MVAFWVDILSPGKPSLFHWATIASSVSIDTGSKPSVMVIGVWCGDDTEKWANRRETFTRKKQKSSVIRTEQAAVGMKVGGKKEKSDWGKYDLILNNSGTILCVRLWPSGCAGRASRGCPAALSCTSWRRSRRRRWRLQLGGRRRWGFPPVHGTEPLSEPSAHSHSETCTVTRDTYVWCYSEYTAVNI